MKRILAITGLVTFMLTAALGQDSNLPGQDFDLEALPGIIETVETFEDLEKALNTESNEINNLDLDKDGEVDYISIDMEQDGEAFIAFLRVGLSETESQTVATIEMEKQSATTASFQIVGEEALYGKDYILEPEGGVVDISEASSKSGSGKSGPSARFIPPPPAVRVTICVGVYRPGFRVWVSPYGFRVYPAWFRPWRPVARHHYRTRAARWHRSSYRRAQHYRSTRARNMHKKYYKAPKATPYGTSSKKNYNTKSTTTQQKANTKNTQYKKSTQQQKSTQPKNTQQRRTPTTTKKR